MAPTAPIAPPTAPTARPWSPPRHTHAPIVSSPLNPTSQCPPGRCVRRRRRSRRNPTLCTRLLRAKVQCAWRDHIISRQMAQDEAGAAMQEASPERQEPSSPYVLCRQEPPKPSRPNGFEVDLEKGQQAQQSRAYSYKVMTPRKVLLAVGMAGVVPALKMHSYLRPAVAV